MIRVSHYPRRDGPLPEGVKWVGRPGRWGNPYKVTETLTAELAVLAYSLWLTEKLVHGERDLDDLAEYEGLACSCPPGQPCHVDVLIEHLESKQ